MLEKGNIRLRIIEENDIKLIQEWHNNYEITRNTTLTSFIPRNISEEISWYERKINDQTSRIFMIEHKIMNEVVGFVSYSNLDYRNQKAYLSIVIGNKNYRKKGIATQALYLIENLLKNEFNIRKVTVQVLSYNKNSLMLFRRNNYNEEGILKQEIFRDGKFHDLHLLSKFL